MDAISNGRPLPDTAKTLSIGRNDAHVWLTFVTESGGMFDLDLSAQQFGSPDLPFPCIVPALRTSPAAFEGHCDRKRILSQSFEECMHTAEEIIQNHVNLVNTMPSKLNLTPAQVWGTLSAIVDKVLAHADTELPKFAADPNHFWNLVRSS